MLPSARRLPTLLPPLLLSACAAFTGPPLAVGQSEAEVRQLMGAPTGTHALADGATRLEFATGPYGRHTWMVDLGRDGRARRVQQVLTLSNLWDFASRASGLRPEDVLRELGRPGERRPAGLAGGETWSWRYVTNDCLWWQVSIGADGRVTGAGQGIDPMCDARDPPGRD